VLIPNPISSPEGSFRYLIIQRIKNFWGYGNLGGSVWFVGMEEGCDGSIQKLAKRFEATSQGEVFDIYSDMRGDADHMKWFQKGAPTQSTYRRLIYLLLYFQKRKEPTLEDTREYQIEHFGRKNSNHAILELMPLPCRSIHPKDWVYASSGVAGLSSRREYLDTYKPKRIKRLRELIREHKPKLVVFYSMTYLKDWSFVADSPFQEGIEKKLHTAKDGGTIYAVVPHPVARGVSSDDWSKIAESIIRAWSHR